MPLANAIEELTKEVQAAAEKKKTPLEDKKDLLKKLRELKKSRDRLLLRLDKVFGLTSHCGG